MLLVEVVALVRRTLMMLLVGRVDLRRLVGVVIVIVHLKLLVLLTIVRAGGSRALCVGSRSRTPVVMLLTIGMVLLLLSVALLFVLHLLGRHVELFGIR